MYENIVHRIEQKISEEYTRLEKATKLESLHLDSYIAGLNTALSLVKEQMEIEIIDNGKTDTFIAS
jgi:hypothetical protein